MVYFDQANKLVNKLCIRSCDYRYEYQRGDVIYEELDGIIDKLDGSQLRELVVSVNLDTWDILNYYYRIIKYLVKHIIKKGKVSVTNKILELDVKIQNQKILKLDLKDITDESQYYIVSEEAKKFAERIDNIKTIEYSRYGENIHKIIYTGLHRKTY